MKKLKFHCKECGAENPTNCHVPLALVTGRYEDLTITDLKEHLRDLVAETKRRGLDHTKWIS